MQLVLFKQWEPPSMTQPAPVTDQFPSSTNKILHQSPPICVCFSSSSVRFCSSCSPDQQDLPMPGCSDVSNGGRRGAKALMSLSHPFSVAVVLLSSFQGLFFFFFFSCSTFCRRPRRRTLSSGCTVTGSPLSQGSSPASQVTGGCSSRTHRGP